MRGISLDLDGYTDLPDGKVASVVTYLEMRERPQSGEGNERPDLTLHRVDVADTQWYRALFRRIGTNWLWFGRLKMLDDELTAILDDPAVEIFSLIRQGREVGLLELDFRDPANVELAYFGLVPEAIGGGIGHWLLDQAIELAWSRPETQRFWVHTCTLDAPTALNFYRRSGFQPYKRAVEVADDPRLAGHLTRDAAPQVPLIEALSDEAR